MDTKSRVQVAVNAAVMRLLRPLCRLLLRYQVPFGAFEELAKHVYVQTALEDFAIPGRKPTLSRASILTGLTRKDVQRLVGRAAPERVVAEEGYNRAARVLTAWSRDPDFQDAQGRPAPLPLQDGEHSFSALVRRHSGDMPARAVMDEMLRVGAVRQRASDGRLELVQRAYVPRGGEVEKLLILGTDVADLIATIDHNVQHGAEDPRFQRKVMYRRVDAGLVPAFRRLSAREGQALLERLDRWLARRCDGDDPPPGRAVRLGLGIHYFEAPSRRGPDDKET